jgi:hypothetical protein
LIPEIALPRAVASAETKPATRATSELTVPDNSSTTPSKSSTSFCAFSAAP